MNKTLLSSALLFFFFSTNPTALPALLEAPEISEDEGAVDVDGMRLLQEKAYDVRDLIKTQSPATNPYIRQLDSLIQQLTEQQLGDAELAKIEAALPRYRLLADACRRAERKPEVLKKVLALLRKRDELVHAIAQPTYTCLQANRAIYNLTAHLGRRPTAAEKKVLTDQRDALVLAKNERVMALNAELFAIEKQLLKDTRPWLARNGKGLAAFAIALTGAVTLLLTINKVHAFFSTPKK